MRSAGGGADTGGLPSGSGRPAGADDQQRPPGGASLFTPAYRVSHAADPARSGQAWSDSPPADSSDRGYHPAEYGQGEGDRGGYQNARYGGPAGHGGWPDEDLGSAYGWSADEPDAWPTSSLQQEALSQPVASKAVRGFPPAPGDALPVYPPGPFAAWNRAQPGSGDGRGQADRHGLTDSSQLATATITPTEFDTDYSIPAIKDPIAGQSSGRPSACPTRTAAPRLRALLRRHRRAFSGRARPRQRRPGAGRREREAGPGGRAGRSARQPGWR